MTKVKVGKEDLSSAEFVEKRRSALERYLMNIQETLLKISTFSVLQTYCKHVTIPSNHYSTVSFVLAIFTTYIHACPPTVNDPRHAAHLMPYLSDETALMSYTKRLREKPLQSKEHSCSGLLWLERLT